MKHSECTFVHGLLALRPADWDESERQRAEAHLSTCAECAALSRAYAAQDRALQSLPAAGLGEAAREQLFSRLEQEKTLRLRSRSAWVFGAVFGAVALAAIVLLSSLLLWPGAWIWSARQDNPTTIPTRATMPSPTITPTTSLTPTPVGEKGLHSGLPAAVAVRPSPGTRQAAVANPFPISGRLPVFKGGKGP